MRSRLVRILFERGGLLGLAVAALYLAIAPAHVIDGDNAEFCTLGALGGAGHPPGYPLFVLWLRAMSWLPGASPAHTAALATALLGALSIVVLHAACRAWGARPLAATLACAIYAGAPVVIAIYTEAEVFALNGVIVGGVLLLAARGGPLRGTWRAGALGLVAGLGLANQLTCALAAPVGVLGAIRGAREARRPALAIAAALGGLALGLVPYLYLLVAPVHEATWGDLHGVRDLVHMFLRLDYGGPTNLATDRAGVPALTSLGALADTFGRTWLWLPALAGLAALALRIARGGDDTHEPRWGWAVLAASAVIAGPVLALRFNIAPEGPGKWVVDRFHLLPSLLVAPAVADAFDRLIARVPQLERRASHVLAVLAFVAIAAAALPHVARVHVPAVEMQARNLLKSLPPDAVVIGIDDDVAGGVFYEQLVLGERKDVAYMHAALFGLPWYRARLVARGFAMDGVIDDLLAHGRPVFVQPAVKDAVAAFPHYRYGILMRLLPRGTRPPSLDEVVAMNEQLYATFEIPYARPGAGDEWPAAVHDRYARTWRALAAQLEAAGEHDRAARAAELAREIGPEP